MSPAAVIGALQRSDGLTIRQLFGREHDESQAMELMDELIRNGNVTELDGRYYLRHSKLPEAADDQANAAPVMLPLPVDEDPPEQPAPRKRGVPAGLRNTPGSLARAAAEREAIAIALEAADGPLTIPEIVARANVPYKTAASRLQALRKAGVAQPMGRGKWITATGQAAQKDVQDAHQPAAEVKQLHPALRALIEELPPPGQRWTHKEAFVVALTGIMDFLYPDCAEGG